MEKIRTKPEHAKVKSPLLYQISNRPVFGTYFALKGGIDYCGEENLQRFNGSPFILAPVHRSMIDPAVIANTLLKANKSHVHFMAKKEIWEWGPALRHLPGKIAGWYVGLNGAFPVERGSGKGLEETAETIDDLVDRNGIIGIFPEATTRYQGNEVKLETIKKGVGSIALKYGLPIIPVGIAGSGKGDKGPFHVEYGKPIFALNAEKQGVSKSEIVRIRNNLVAAVHDGMQEAQDLAVEHRY